jgi:hypothetical protein
MTTTIVDRVNSELRHHERILTRADGQQVRLLTRDFTSPFSSSPELHTDVFTLSKEGHWQLLSDLPRYPGKKLGPPGTTREDYLREGRPPIYYHTSFAEMVHAKNAAMASLGYH